MGADLCARRKDVVMKQEERACVYFSEDGVCVRERQQGACVLGGFCHERQLSVWMRARERLSEG